MTEHLKWRLGKLPTPDEVISLLKEKIITQEEAKEILFNKETEEDRDKNSFKEEIKFLREMVEKLASDRSKTVEAIKYLQPFYSGSWTTPYIGWSTGTCGSYTTSASLTGGGSTAYLVAATSGSGASCSNFTEITTF